MSDLTTTDTTSDQNGMITIQKCLYYYTTFSRSRVYQSCQTYRRDR